MIQLEQFRQAVIEAIKEVKELETVFLSDSETFGDFGLDSLDGMEMVLQVEARLGIDLGEFDLKDANTIDRFYAKACEILAQKSA